MLTQLFGIEGISFLLRWFHIFFGVIWIGLLYYFNFVQGSYFNEADSGAKSNAIQKLVPRALWWFRYAALWTVITGLVIYMIRGHQLGDQFLQLSYGVNITVGMLLGLVMASNVWFVIWPNQKIVIQSATQVAGGGQALPQAGAAAAKALLASRTNTLFSIPMLFFMAAASHWTFQVGNSILFLILAIVIITGLEVNALKGKLGPLTTIKGVITSGFLLTLLFVILLTVTQG